MPSEDLNVFDLDGTLIKVNSFREVTKQLVLTLLTKFQIIPLLAITGWYILRRCGIVCHLKLKERIVNIFEKSLSDREKKDICQTVFDKNVNRTVFERMASLDNCIITTASPFAYVSRMFFNKDVTVIGSLVPDNRFPNAANSGSGKIDNLKACFKGKDVHVINFFTDNNIDDQALIDFSNNAFIVQGDRLTKVK